MRAVTTWTDLLRPGDGTDFFSRRPFPPFEPHAAGFSRTNALWLAELSRLIYRRDVEEENPPKQPTRSGLLATAGLRQVAFFRSEETDTQGMLVQRDVDPVYAVLVFRGTEQRLKDFLTDLRVGTDALVGDDYAVHEGFRQSLESVWQDVDRALSGLSCPVFYTGHSLGGALATLAAARRRPRGLYTFGSPRVGNQAFVRSLGDVPVFRVVDDWDAVAVLPPEALGFEHVGELIDLSEPSVPFTINPLAWLKLMFSPAKFLADHAPVNYVDRV